MIDLPIIFHFEIGSGCFTNIRSVYISCNNINIVIIIIGLSLITFDNIRFFKEYEQDLPFSRVENIGIKPRTNDIIMLMTIRQGRYY